jgi:F-type H+-transporting ATPase subunit epsilon
MHVEMVAVDRPIWSGEASMVVARTAEGEIGVLDGHTPLLATLEPGWLVRVVRQDEDDLRVAVHGGFLSVREDGVSVMAETAEEASEIDVDRAREALSRAEAAQETGDEDAEAVARDARNRALARLRAAGEAV